MNVTYVLIDYENVQPDALDVLDRENFHTIVFVGANQSKLAFDTAIAVQRLGSRAEYLRISGAGSNALDFHIAYYIGRLSTQNPSAHFYIISNDTGFDPLIAHLAEKKIRVTRVKNVLGIPGVQAVTPKAPDDRLTAIASHLQRLGASKPRTVKTLANTIATLGRRQLSPEDVQIVIKQLEQRGVIAIVNTRVTFAPQ